MIEAAQDAAGKIDFVYIKGKIHDNILSFEEYDISNMIYGTIIVDKLLWSVIL